MRSRLNKASVRVLRILHIKFVNTKKVTNIIHSYCNGFLKKIHTLVVRLGKFLVED